LTAVTARSILGLDLGPGEAYLIAPGHDAWVLGDVPFVGVEFSSADRFARG
jgi:hypothetical protein